MIGVAVQSAERMARRALLWKELRECRAAVIAGASIFLGLPLLWTVLYALFDAGHEIITGMASGLLMVGGWLFAAVLAAQTVCRDFGRGSGTFLLARPVTPGEIVRAKIAASFGILLALLAATGLLELVVWPLRAPIASSPFTLWWVAAAASLFTYWVALAVAMVTRQTLSSVMLAVLGLALVVVLPTLTGLPTTFTDWAIRTARGAPGTWTSALAALADGRLASESYDPTFYNPAHVPPWLTVALSIAGVGTLLVVVLDLLVLAIQAARRRPPTWRWQNVVLYVLLFAFLSVALRTGNGLCAAAGLAVYFLARIAMAIALRAGQAEGGWALGTRALACTVGGSLVLVFLLAMNEVGANVPVASTWWLDMRLNRDVHFTHLASGRHRVAAVQTPGIVLRFDIDPAGQVRQVMRSTALEPRSNFGGPFPFFDADDNLYDLAGYAGCAGALDRKPGTPIPEPYLTLSRLDWDDGRRLSEVHLELPADLPRPLIATVQDAYLDGDRLSVLFSRQPCFPKVLDASSPCTVLAVYRLDPDGSAILEWAQRGPWDWPSVRGFRRAGAGWVYPTLRAGAKGLAAPDRHRDDGPANWRNSLAYADYSHTLWLTDSVRVTSNRNGLYICEFQRKPPSSPATTHPVWDEVQIGAVPVSPWATLFRTFDPGLVSPGRGLVWEIEANGAVCYDVSDLHNPRKIAHVVTYPVDDAVAGPEFLVLNHGEGISLVRHPR